jgi:hypothetical protein
VLFHFSEDPSIRVFHPHVPATNPAATPAVWAIDAWHAPLYYFPRDCPRIVLWTLPTTTAEDRARWLGDPPARMVAYVEHSWLARLRATTLYRYAFDLASFRSLDDAGMHVSGSPVTPLAPPQPVGDLEAALRADRVELRALPDLTPLRDVWSTTLHASGIRLGNAANFSVTSG